eukprot:1143635-Pelagomonas_calceolata.AAC.1
MGPLLACLLRNLTLMHVAIRLADLEIVMQQPIITSYVCVNQACSPRALAKGFDDHSSGNVVAFSFHAGDDMILAACALCFKREQCYLLLCVLHAPGNCCGTVFLLEFTFQALEPVRELVEINRLGVVASGMPNFLRESCQNCDMIRATS